MGGEYCRCVRGRPVSTAVVLVPGDGVWMVITIFMMKMMGVPVYNKDENEDDKDDHNYYADNEDPPDKGIPVDEEDNGGGKEARCVLGRQVVWHLG